MDIPLLLLKEAFRFELLTFVERQRPQDIDLFCDRFPGGSGSHQVGKRSFSQPAISSNLQRG